MKVDKKYIGDRVQRKFGSQKKSIFGTIVKKRQDENLGRFYNPSYQDERHMMYLIRWDNLCKEKHSWVASHLLVPLWPGVLKNVRVEGSR